MSERTARTTDEARPSRWAEFRSLTPAEFAFVMATGIISTSLHNVHADVISTILLVVALAAYIALWCVHLVRLAMWPKRFLAELVSPSGFTVIALVAASGVTSTRLALGGHHTAATSLWVIAIASWIVLGYGIPLGLIAHAHRHTTLNPVNGTWFLWIVGTQSVAAASATLAAGGDHDVLAEFAAVCWAIGVVQYLLVASVEFARLMLRRIEPSEPIAPYWVFMGAAAITALAGSKLLVLPGTDLLFARSMVETLSTMIWAFATWLIPLLVALSVWQGMRRHLRLDYRDEWWAIVFPIGMYGVASFELGAADGRGWMSDIATWEAWVALAVWVLVVLALFVHERFLRPRRPAPSAGGDGRAE